jgi:maleate isomerase
MPDRFGPRGVVAVLIPLQNSNMLPEYEAMRPAGINNQMYRFSLVRHDKAADAVLDAVPDTLLHVGGSLGIVPLI